MSQLGDCAENGESGSVTRVAHMPDQIPDNPRTVAATTGIETIMQLLTMNWIWKAQLSVDTSMLPGHVFGLFKIHPQDCHQYVSYFSKPFMAWVGSMKIRARFQATFQYGGSLRIGWLPPKFTRQQVQNLSIQTLTAYPNIDLDPKNTGFMEFQASEERNVLFHWMDSLDSDDPATFGGWYVFYVAAPLVISGGGTGEKITLLVETAGGFDFVQPNDLTPNVSPTLAILDQDPIFYQTGCDDYTRVDAIQVHPLSERSLITGWHFARGTQNRYTRDIVPNITYTQDLKTFIEAIGRLPSTTVSMEYDSDSGKTVRFKPAVVNNQININSEARAYFMSAAFVDQSQSQDQPWEMDSASFYGTLLSGNNAIFFTGPNLPAGYVTDKHYFELAAHNPNPNPIVQDKLGIYTSLEPDVKDPSTMPIIANESLITFVSTQARSINIQTTQMGIAISRSKMDNSTSQLYQVWTEDGTSPLLTVRLTPYGYFTTKSVTVPALITGKNLYFKYLQDLPMNTPIPTSSYERTFLRRAQRCTAKQYSGQKLEEELWEYY